MGTLSYTAGVSLDGYVVDADGDFQWSAPSDEVFQFHIDRLAGLSTEVLGRKTYQLMRYWEQEPTDEPWSELEREFARGWQGIEHIVVSSTLSQDDLGPSNVRLVPDLKLAELERIVADAPAEVEIFGPTTAAGAVRAGLVSDFRFFLAPMIVGGGLRALPEDARLELTLAEHRTFKNGSSYLHYQPR